MKTENGAYLNTLGVALYRTGQFEDALETLSRSDELNGGGLPADVAFLAMAKHRLGDAKAARDELARLRKLMEDPPWSSEADAKRLLEEAEALIERAPSSRPRGE